MKIKVETIKQINIAIAFFFAFAGYYAVLMLLANVGLSGVSRYFTIPVRVLIVVCLGIVFILKPRFKLTKPLLLFIIFSCLYYLRIVIEYFDTFSKFHMSEVEFLLYFSSFVFLPVLLLSNIRFSEKNYKTIFLMIMLSGLLMSLMTIYFYGSLVGETSRISLLISQNENFISPLALSYSSSLTIGIGLLYLMANKTSKKISWLVFLVIGLSVIPFLLGASRGSVIALIVPFLIYFTFKKGVENRLKILFLAVFSVFGLYFLSELAGSGAFNRLFGIEEDFERGGGASIRLDMWRRGLQTFAENPVFGNSLESEYYSHHPHNVIIESLISTGFLGVLPFVFTLYYCFKACAKVVRQNPEYFWITAIFIQAISQNMFSGSIYGASWLAIGIGLVFGLNIKEDDKY